MLGLLKRLRHRRQTLRDASRDARALAGWVERSRIIPNFDKAIADLWASQVFEVNAESLAIGKLNIVFSLAREIREDLDTMPDIADEEKRRPAPARRQRLGGVLGLVAGIYHEHAPTARCGPAPTAFCFHFAGGGGASWTGIALSPPFLRLCL